MAVGPSDLPHVIVRAGLGSTAIPPPGVRTAREDAVGLSTQAKHRVKAFLLRQGRRYPGRAGWTLPYRRWLADLSVPLAPQHIALAG